MRALTFKGFLTQYVRQLSHQNTLSLHKLSAEAASDNPRLREPLLLYAMFSGKLDLLLAVTHESLLEYYTVLVSQYTVEQITSLLDKGSPLLAMEYHKVWHSYLNRRDQLQADNHTKALMRKKVQRLQQENGVTNYRIYTDLKLNPGNLNAWLKHGDGNKVSLDTARMALRYVEGISHA